MMKLLPLLSLLVAAPAWAQTTSLFIHVPNTASGTTPQQVVAGLETIASSLTDVFHEEGGEGTPTFCFVGFAGNWQPGQPARPNNAGAAATILGNTHANMEGLAIQIDYCVTEDELTDLFESGDCDFLIAMGEIGKPT